MISQRNICHYLDAAQRVYQLLPDDVVFQGASVAFDLSLEEIFLPYLVGARLWIASSACLQDTEALPRRLALAGITVLDTVPTLLALLPQDIPSLRLIILGGEACPPALAEKWCRPGRHLFNSYGPTETTVVATAIELQPGDPISIGRPLPGYRCHVVDERLQPVADGDEGELLIGGPGVAAGYWRRPELSAAKFD
jgi:non-ribosomal peptide synthetase component F